MKTVFKVFIFIQFFTTFFSSIHAQNFKLIVHSKDSSNIITLNSIPYNKVHISEKNINTEIKNISKKLALKGYINNSYLLNKTDSIFNCVFSLNNKIEKIRIYYSNKFIDNTVLQIISLNYTNTYFEIATNQIENSLNSIVNYFENKGASFTNVSLINLTQLGNKLTAELNLNISEKRKINNIIIKGYNDFSIKYLNNYLNLKQHTTFNLNTLETIDKLVNTISFVTQLKKPEILFTKDSTTLYLYLKKKANNTFDGILGFSNEKNSNNLKFNGYLDLILNNMFNKGESFGLNWKSNGDDTQTLNLKLTTPYIFNTRFSPSGEFSIFKQDSTYVNTKSLFKIKYSINKHNFINALLNNEVSTISSSNTLDEIDNFKTILFGLSYTFKMLPKHELNNRSKFAITASYLLGNKTANQLKSNQNKIQLLAEYNLELNHKNLIYFKTTNKLLNASNLFQNELFRIGGTNSIRGFDEQSIFTSKYSVTNIEYHYIINQTTHLYSITDFAIALDNFTNSTTKLYGIGLGYYFNTKSSIINLSYAIGKNNELPFGFKNSKVHIKVTYPF